MTTNVHILRSNDPRGIALIRNRVKALCPECDWVCLWILQGHSLHCCACGWTGEATDVFLPGVGLNPEQRQRLRGASAKLADAREALEQRETFRAVQRDLSTAVNDLAFALTAQLAYGARP